MTAILSASMMLKTTGGGGGVGSSFVAISGSAGSAASSIDGTTWVARTLPGTRTYRSVAWNGNLFCAVNNDNGAAAVTSPDGIVWTQRILFNSFPGADGIAWGSGAGAFVIVYSGDTVSPQFNYSSDGITWSGATGIQNGGGQGVCWNGSIFCAVNPSTISGTNACTSPDGVHWTAQTIGGGTNQWADVAWNGTVFCAIAGGTSLSQLTATSPDGAIWTTHAGATSSHKWTALAWNGTVFCAINSNSAIASTSPDGITWTDRTMAGNQPWSDIAWNGAVFCAVANTADTAGHSAATSPDGTTWTYRAMPSVDTWGAICAQRILP